MEISSRPVVGFLIMNPLTTFVIKIVAIIALAHCVFSCVKTHGHGLAGLLLTIAIWTIVNS